MFRAVVYLAFGMMALGLLASLLGTAALLAQQFMQFGCLLLLGAAFLACFRKGDDE